MNRTEMNITNVNRNVNKNVSSRASRCMTIGVRRVGSTLSNRTRETVSKCASRSVAQKSRNAKSAPSSQKPAKPLQKTT